ncbi:C25 family cysteine peptidase [Vitiosangium sp. GDMCC 1.1324]|uniref:C25 family cysteine peptidase n=1 Tax=Vitiosangium sp. (strain GDMCC 1.1324) TaxID=2138576 RepID=UPI000D355690|nr:C25 family cysteine peptidase [Vitiosangium sp. GDMCC 1.1324]PTL78191.1 hypothetical protein DAT35_39725 [Vitiosangium sp. GDMCC 1.1324]
MTLELLLAHANDGRPMLQGGLSEETLRGVPIQPPEVPERLWSDHGNLDVLKKQRWGLVVPEGPEGNELLERIKPLRELREADQDGKEARVYRVAPGMNGPRAMAWKQQVFRDEDVDERERPRYLLVLGDLHQVSLELQQALATDAYVGRLAFRSPEQYTAYASKVVRWERATVHATGPRMLFYTAQDGSEATRLGHEDLIEPCLEACRTHLPDAKILHVLDDDKAPGKQLLERAAEPTPSLLLSLSHGLGRPDGGWRSPTDQFNLQGALQLPGRQLSGADLVSGAFLPGGMWVCFACFSAGTPARSTYAPWLRELAKTSLSAAQVLDALPGWEGEHSFIAALPQAALANPDGPLAVVGHVDLAWSSSFRQQGQRTPSRFFGVLQALAEGHRVGNALTSLARSFHDLNMALTVRDAHAALEHEAGRKVLQSPAVHASLFLQRQDLMGFVLLGDPAARLSIPFPKEES